MGRDNFATASTQTFSTWEYLAPDELTTRSLKYSQAHADAIFAAYLTANAHHLTVAAMSFIAPPGVAIVPLGLEQGAAVLARRDRDFMRIVATAGMPRFQQRPATFGTLLHIILEQQVSIEAARAMYARLKKECRWVTPQRFLGLDEEILRRCGFSRQKAGYGRHLAQAILDGLFDPKSLARHDDETALAELIKLKGIGRWSAEVFLLFALARPDVWPADDLGLQLAVQWLKNMDHRPTGAALRELAETWRPWRAVAACLLWQFYLHRLGRLV
jgi:DNA-3-methyladenine glycosylase II